jgi:ABC-2 type transport system permease protein
MMGGIIEDILLSSNKIGVMDYDNSNLSKEFKLYLTEDLNYELVEHDNYDYLSELLIDKDISSIIEIPEGFYDLFASGRDGRIIITSTDDFENAAYLEAYMNSYLAGIRLLSTSAEGDSDTFDGLLTDYKDVEIPISKAKAYEFDIEKFRQSEGFRNTIGFFLMIIFALGVILSFMIIDDRANGIYKRVTITPVKPVQYIAGNSIFGLILSFIMISIYCAYMAFLDIDIGFPIYKLFLLMIIFSFFVICFAVGSAMLIRSKGAVGALVIGFSTVGAILGGAYFPLDMAPESLQNLARILPQFWFMDTIRKLMDNPMANVTSNIIILLLFSILAFLIGAVIFSQNYKKG